MLTKFSELREGVTRILEENSELKIENQHLREMLGKRHQQAERVTNGHLDQLPRSRKNLIKLYNEGFHICNQFFGQHRDEHDNCLFCNEILFRNDNKNPVDNH